jgi:hypothetical protein
MKGGTTMVQQTHTNRGTDMNRRNRTAQLAAALLALGAACGARAAEGYTTWDNFEGATQVNEKRWLGTDRHRMIEGGALRMIQRDLGSQTNNTDVFNNSWSTSLTNPGPVTQMKGSITVNAFEISHCAANANVGVLQARFTGSFFNAGPGVPAPGNRINDVGAVIRLRRDSNSADAANVLRVQGTVFQCTTSDCNYGTIGLGDVDLGTALVGETVVLKMEWDKPNKRFNFFRGSDPVQRVTYAVSDALAPASSYRLIGTRTTVTHCMAGRTEGFIDAKFDNISVNASALP